jgi:chromosomal replication initiation ATPase DnaA
LPIAQIAPPDEALLQAVLVKLFLDRQLAVEPDVIGYLVVRMERSMAAANEIAAEVDRLGLAMRRRITKQLAQTALKNLENRRTGS